MWNQFKLRLKFAQRFITLSIPRFGFLQNQKWQETKNFSSVRFSHSFTVVAISLEKFIACRDRELRMKWTKVDCMFKDRFVDDVIFNECFLPSQLLLFAGGIKFSIIKLSWRRRIRFPTTYKFCSQNWILS